MCLFNQLASSERLYDASDAVDFTLRFRVQLCHSQPGCSAQSEREILEQNLPTRCRHALNYASVVIVSFRRKHGARLVN